MQKFWIYLRFIQIMEFCCIYQVPGIFELKGHDHVHCVDVASLNVDGEDQFLPNQKKDVTYVSRLQVNIQLRALSDA